MMQRAKRDYVRFCCGVKMKLVYNLIFLLAVVLLTSAQGSPAQAIERLNDGARYPPLSQAIMQTELTDLDGGKFRLDDFRGKVILVNLWASWCGPCRPQMAELVELQNKYDRHNFEIIGLDVGDELGNPETARAMKVHADRIKVNFYLALGTNVKEAFYSLAQFEGIPLSILIDQDGRLRAIIKGAGPNATASIKGAVEKVVNMK